MMDKAWEVLDDKLKVLENGEVESESPSPVLDIAGKLLRFLSPSRQEVTRILPTIDAIITDTRGFHLPTGKDHELPLSEKLRLQLSWDTQVFELARHLKKNAVPRDVINYFDERVQKEGWQRCVLGSQPISLCKDR
jgi:hypothetical protein